jgi:hypothetical protein
MLGPNVPSQQCSMSCNQHATTSHADSCRASAMSDHFTQHTPIRLTLITKPCELNKSQNHAETDRPQPIQPSHANQCHAANQVRDKHALNQTMSETNTLNTANYVRDKHASSTQPKPVRQPRRSPSQRQPRSRLHVRQPRLDIHARDKHDLTCQHLPKSTFQTC